MNALVDDLMRIGSDHGLEKVGVCSADSFSRTLADLLERKEAGLHAGMQFTYRNPVRSTDPRRTLAGAESIVVGALSYRRAARDAADASVGSARIGEYVWEPHYQRLRAALDAIAARLRDDGWKARVLVDDNALVDRAAAHRAGIGWFGKNSNILLPGRGSRFVLGSLLTDAHLPTAPDRVADGCGTCRRCIDNCPTGAIVADGVIDSRRCLAWLVQATGVFPREYRDALGDRIYGCDDCQSTCPPNVRLDRADPPRATSGISSVDVVAMLEMPDDQLIDRFGDWYIPGREPRYLRRNALVVLANTADPADAKTRRLVADFCGSDDPIERSHAVWAASRLGYDDLVAAASTDEDPLVRDEVAAITGHR